MFFGNRLKTIRLENGLTQENLGKLIGVGKVTISKWESGMTVPNAHHLSKLEQTFLVERDYFDEFYDLTSSYRSLNATNQQSSDTKFSMIFVYLLDEGKRLETSLNQGRFTRINCMIMTLPRGFEEIPCHHITSREKWP
nr:helix-turn-helix transcriptional regulator [Streptococcus sp. X13SY08]